MYAIISALIVVVIGAVLWFVFFNKKEVSIDLASLKQSIETKGHYNEMSMMELDKETIQTLFQIDAAQIEEGIGAVPMINVQSSMYIVVKASKGNVEQVKEKLEAYGQAQETIWERYLPEQYDLVKNRKVGTVGEYAYLVIGENAEEVVALIK